MYLVVLEVGWGYCTDSKFSNIRDIQSETPFENRMIDSTAKTQPKRKHLMFVGRTLREKKCKRREKGRAKRWKDKQKSAFNDFTDILFFDIFNYFNITELIILLYLNWLTKEEKRTAPHPVFLPLLSSSCWPPSIQTMSLLRQIEKHYTWSTDVIHLDAESSSFSMPSLES